MLTLLIDRYQELKHLKEAGFVASGFPEASNWFLTNPFAEPGPLPSKSPQVSGVKSRIVAFKVMGQAGQTGGGAGKILISAHAE